ncbi:MAG: methyltransferase domain-containing protein [Candidatus Moraniibacteriota bacterium]
MKKEVLQKEPACELNLKTFTGSFISPEAIVADWGIKAGDTVADFGCGNGFFTLPLAHRVGEKGKIYAIDVLAVPLEAVTSQAYLGKYDNIITIRADLERKNSLSDTIKKDECQFVFIANALCTAKKKKTILAEAKRILDPQGQLIVVEWTKGVSDAFRGFGPPVDSRFTEDELRDLVVNAGFKLVDRFTAGEFHFGMRFKKK